MSAAQLSVPPQGNLHSPSNGGDDTISDEEEARKRRELLARRPSYRRILNDLSDVERDLKQEVNDVGSNSEDGTDTTSAPNQNNTSPPNHRVDTGRNYNPGMLGVAPALSVNANGEISQINSMSAGGLLQYSNESPQVSSLLVPANNDLLGLKPVTGSPLSGMSGSSCFSSQGLGLIPSGYASSSPSPHGLSCNSPSLSHDGPVTEEASRKRQIRLLKNREAAKECRRKKKEYVKCLENRVAVLENQNKALIEELKTLKDLYCRKSD